MTDLDLRKRLGKLAGPTKMLLGPVFLLILLPFPRLYAEIRSLSPNAGTVGSTMAISGTNFGPGQNTSTVMFTDRGRQSQVGATLLSRPWSRGATTGNAYLSSLTSGIASNGVIFTVVPSPVITQLSPPTGLPGASVVISGNNFGQSQGRNTVTFNGTGASVMSWSANTIIVTVPSGATGGAVVVTVNGVPSNELTFTISR